MIIFEFFDLDGEDRDRIEVWCNDHNCTLKKHPRWSATDFGNYRHIVKIYNEETAVLFKLTYPAAIRLP